MPTSWLRRWAVGTGLLFSGVTIPAEAQEDRTSQGLSITTFTKIASSQDTHTRTF